MPEPDFRDRSTNLKPAPASRVIALAMVKNEQDIIEPFVRHNLRFVDVLIVGDHGSADATRDILVNLSREFDSLVVGDISGFGYSQAEHMTRLLHAAQTAFFADYVMLLDADEFIDAPDRAAFLTALSVIPSGGYGLIPWRTGVLVPENIARQTADPPRSISWRRAEERPRFCKAVLRLDAASIADLKIELGNHAVSSLVDRPISGVELEAPVLQHFPIRSREQFIAKCVVGWMAYLAKNPDAYSSDRGFQWRENADRVAAGSSMTDAELAKISLHYATEPGWTPVAEPGAPPSDYVRHYSNAAALEPMPLIVRSWTRSLASRPKALELERPPGGAEGGAAKVAGAFDGGWHWDHLFVDIPPFRAIAERHRPASVLDIGCGVGAYLRLFLNLGATHAVGVDGVAPELIALDSGEYHFHDLTRPLDLGSKFDLVMCIEVAEHLDPVFSTVLIDSIARHARGLIVFSAAEPGQPGIGHVNCRPLAYWLDEWRMRGWRPEENESLALRALASFTWFRRNLMVLRPEREVRQDGTELLRSIATRHFSWRAQPPGIREMPFMEEASDYAGGYC